MRLPVVWLPEAEVELKAALARYEGIRPELGQRFAEAVVVTVEGIARGPGTMRWWEQDGGGPECIDSHTGYSSSSKTRGFVVIACFHGRRDPKHWQTR